MKNVEYVITQQEVETFFTRKFSDKEWTVLISEINGIIEHYVWTDLPTIVKDLDSIVEDYDLE